MAGLGSESRLPRAPTTRPTGRTVGTPQANPPPFLSFPAHPTAKRSALPPPEGPRGRSALLVPVGEQVKLLLFEEGSLELRGSRGLDAPTLPGDVQGSWRRASGGQAEAVAVRGRSDTRHHQGSGPGSTREAPEGPAAQAPRGCWDVCSDRRGSPAELHPLPSPAPQMGPAAASTRGFGDPAPLGVTQGPPAGPQGLLFLRGLRRLLVPVAVGRRRESRVPSRLLTPHLTSALA